MGWGPPQTRYRFFRTLRRGHVFQCFNDNPEHAILILQNVIVPETENSPAFARQKCVPPLVLARDRVLAAVGFND
jgi:hypothetical protein